MRLKSIDIKGFKSFYHRTKVEFSNGIVSIVGPNGSGKSNILDAFRWVFGEQSAKNLRGEKMEDIIFSGTARHNQSNFCEVEVVFDNTDNSFDIDFSEISIKRKAFRNGDNTYYINGKQSRLKDIKELFLDSGIGKEGYSIISQGKIDEIVNSNSVQRRKLLEEASGIAKFRFKKEESEKKIDNAKSNLLRLEDIYREIERQIEPLFIQKSKAEKYLELSEQLKNADLSLMLKEFDKIHADSYKDQKSYEEVEKKIYDIDRRLEQNKDDIRKLEKNSIAHKSLISNLENDKNRLAIEKNNLNNEIDKSNQKIELLKVQQKKLQISQHSINETISKLMEKQVETNHVVDGLYDLKKQNSAEILENDKFVGNVDIELRKCEEKIDVTTSELGKYKNEIQQCEIKLQFLEENIQRYEIVKDENENSIRDTENQILSLEEESKYTLGKLQDLEIQKVKLEEKFNSISKDMIVSSRKKEILLSDINVKKKELNELTIKRDMYNSLEKEMDGINKSVKTILKNSSLQGIIDIVSNIISTEKKYEKAIETSLGTSLQYIVTTDSNSAKYAIEYLKSTKMGRATFLPIDSIQGKKLSIDSVVIASDVVVYEGRFKNIVQQLLGRTIIAENLDNAINLAKKYEYKYRIVTLDGEIYNVGGSLTGGHYYKTSNILSRKRYIQEYNSKISALETELDALYVQLSVFDKDSKNISDMQSNTELKLEDIKVKIQDIRLESSDTKNKLNYLSNVLKNLKEESQYNSSNKLTNEKNIKEIRIRQVELQRIIDEKQFLLAELNSEKQKISGDFHQKNEKKNELLLKSIEITNKLEIQKMELDRILTQIDEYKVQLNDIKKENLSLNDEISSLEKTILENLLKLNLCEVERDQILMEFENAVEKLDKENQELQSVSDMKYELDNSKLSFMEEKFKLESKIERFITLEENIIFKLKEEYDLEIDDLRDMNLLSSPSRELISRLRKEIQELGNINLDSIEEYSVLSERYETYKTQIDDLNISIDELEEIIRNLEKDMSNNFSNSFANINKTFGIVFSKMFGGGEGRLILENPSDILNSDIEIFAQPPGKKLKSITVMSGGEKALMSIALLFAIQMTKPAPFCILDEIDAALDDSNIARFNVFLKQMSDEIQFVTITHRRGTMETSDYIYGVTMQDKGVSKVVSLMFDEAQEYIEQ